MSKYIEKSVPFLNFHKTDLYMGFSKNLISLSLRGAKWRGNLDFHDAGLPRPFRARNDRRWEKEGF